MNTYWTFIALDVANERTREADRHRLAAIARRAYPARDRSIRHGIAVVVAALSRASAALVRRLDECVADDLATGFRKAAPTAN